MEEIIEDYEEIESTPQENSVAIEEEVIAEEIPGTGGIIGGGSPFENIRIRVNGQDIFM